MLGYSYEDPEDEDKHIAALAGVPPETSAPTAAEAAAEHSLDDIMVLAEDPTHPTPPKASVPAEAEPAKTFEAPNTHQLAKETVAGHDAGGQDESSYFQALAGERVSNERARDEADAKEDSFGGHISGWALAADLLLNKGRGLGQIMSTANEQSSRARGERKELARINAGKGDKAAQQEIERGAQALRLRQIQNDERRTGLDEKYAEHPELKPLNQLEQATLANSKAIMADREHDNAVGDERSKYEHGRQETLDKEHVREFDASQQTAKDARAESRADREFYKDRDRTDRQQRQADTDKTKADAAADTFEHRYETKNARSLDALKAIQTAEGIMDRYKGKDVPGIGEYDSAVSEAWGPLRSLAGVFESPEFENDAEAMRIAKKNAADFTLREESGANAPDAELIRTKGRTGSEVFASEDQTREAMKQFRDVVTARLKGGATANPERARAILEARGLNPDSVLGKRVEAAVEVPSPEATVVRPQVLKTSIGHSKNAPAEVGELGVAAVPKTQPDDFTNDGGDTKPQRIRVKVDGKVGTLTTNAAGLEKFMKDNPQAELLDE